MQGIAPRKVSYFYIEHKLSLETLIFLCFALLPFRKSSLFTRESHVANLNLSSQTCFQQRIPCTSCSAPNMQIGALSKHKWHGPVQLEATSESYLFPLHLCPLSLHFFFLGGFPPIFISLLCLPVAPPTRMALICPTSIRRLGAAQSVLRLECGQLW